MKFKIIFKKTGDSIPFRAVNPELLEYYVNCLTKTNNNSFQIESNFQPSKTINSLISLLNEIKTWPLALLELEDLPHDDYFEQRVLNKLHADWVRSQNSLYNIDDSLLHDKSGLAKQIQEFYPDSIKYPRMGDILKKMGLSEIYSSVNRHVHDIENSFDSMLFRSVDCVNFENPFPPELATNDICNLKLQFGHLGRTLYNKYQNYDFDLEFDDENTFGELLGLLRLNLRPIETIPYSSEYISWCKVHDRTPSGDNLNIGNIIDLDKNLKQYRIVLNNNLVQGNDFFIEI